MRLEPFGVEQWMNEWETRAVRNLAETCVDSMTTGELLELSGNREEIAREIMETRLSYGDIFGSDELRENIASMYKQVRPENVVVMNGGAAANFIGLFTLIEPGDEVICVYPTYQQLYSIPRVLGASVKLLPLRFENGFMPDMGELEKLVTPRTKLICVNNPNNPTGSMMDEETLREVIGAAERVGAWLYCDEAYRFMPHKTGGAIPSVADMYERGIVSCGLSKCFSLAGLRLGWLAGPDEFVKDVLGNRDYTTISCGRLDDLLGRVAVKNRDAIFSRNLAIVSDCIKVLDDWIETEPRVAWVKPRAGTVAFPRYDYDIPSEDFCRLLFERDGTFILPGKCFGSEFDRHFRIGYAYEPGVLAEGLERVSAFLRSLEAKGL